MNSKVEKGDTVALRDGRSVTVMSVKPDYETGGFVRFDFIDPSEASPMRRTAYPSDLLQILRKNPTPMPDPKAVRSYDDPEAGPQKVIIVDGQEYISRGPVKANTSPESIINPNAGAQVHQAVKAPAKPVMRRGKTDKQVKQENEEKGS